MVKYGQGLAEQNNSPQKYSLCGFGFACLMGILLALSSVSVAAQERNDPIAILPAVAPVLSCSQLATESFPSATDRPMHVTSARAVEDGKPAPYCRVLGYVEPHIQFEVRLPTSGWTQRFLETGCGGQCGNLSIHETHDEGCYPANHGDLVLASTDMGHTGTFDGVWARGDAQARIDFAYRGLHQTVLAAKAIIEKYYGQGAKFSYFTGCSDGGRQALMEVERFPGDFDGVVAGAPGMNFITQNTFYHGWNARENTDADGHAILTADKLPLLHQAVLSACDQLDGVKDEIIGDPRRCHFDPGVLACRPNQDAASCLTPAQVNVVREIYKGAHTADGKQLVISGPQPGSELAWAGVYVPKAPGQPLASWTYAEGTLRYLVFQHNPGERYSLSDLKFDRATFDAIRPMHALYDTTDPDLTPFIDRGGKMIIWHGWADPHISPLNSIAYYGAMQSTMGKAKVQSAIRLYLFPGVYHCGGGPGPSQIDLLTPIMAWVERGVAPRELVVSRPATPESSTSAMTRPVYPYPLIAHYTGKGNADNSESWTAARPTASEPDTFDWLGAPFYASHYEEWCTGKGDAMTCSKQQ